MNVLRSFVCFTLFVLWLLLFIVYIPVYYDWIYGDEIVESHLKDVVSNETRHEFIAALLLDWLKREVHYPLDEEAIFALGGGFGIYKIENKTRIFFRNIVLRNVPVSWTIKTKLGRCGEDTLYFIEMMDKKGYRARKIRPKGWDHTWADYFTEEGNKIIVNPSDHEVINDPIGFAKDKNWTEIWAYDLNGSKEDVSKEYG